MNFFCNGAAFAGCYVAAIEPAGDELILGGIGKQVPGQLFCDEHVIRFIVVESTDDPVPIGPHFAKVVQVKAMSVAVSCNVQPVA